MSAHGSAVSSNSSGIASDSDAEQEGLQAFAVSSSSSSSSGHVPHEETDDDVILQDNLARYCLENFEAGVKDHTLEQLHLPDEWIEEIKITWHDFIEKAGSRQAAGEAVWDAIMELSPGIRKAFSFARQVFAMRFINGTSSIITDCGEPRTLKDKAERLAFQHIDTVDRDYVETFSNGIAVAMDGILGRRFSQLSYQSFRVLWNYIGGVFLYVKREYGGRVKRIIKSWQVTNKNVGKDPATDSVGKDLPAASTQSVEAPGSREASKSQKRIQTPETFKDMFMFNASIMGFTDSEWMSSTLDALGAMATNADKPYRLQEECHVLALVLCRKYLKGKQKLSLAPFKAVLLASLRSVMPEEWDMDLEDAWSWFWGEIARMISGVLGKLSRYKRNLKQLVPSLSEKDLWDYREKIFENFFETTPRARDYLKVSTTRLFFVVDRILMLTIHIHEEPAEYVQEISAVGLKHVGMNIPSEFFAPLADAVVESIQPYVDERRPLCLEAFRWTMSLFAQIMTRVSLEGSTLVMKAVSQNDAVSLRSALATAPRKRRMQDVLSVTVGSQSISPLDWSIDTGHLDCATTIIQDLLTIRGDRQVYYYGCDALFERHPDFISKLSVNAPALLFTLLDGLIWRSRIVERDLRRAIYYIKNLIQDGSGNFSENIERLAEHGDPKVIVHPCASEAIDLVWNRLVIFKFLLQRVYFIFTLVILVAGQSFLRGSTTREGNAVVAVCRASVYLFSLGPLLCQNGMRILRDVMEGEIERTLIGPIPDYMLSWKGFSSVMLLLVLIAMLSLEPVIWCLQYGINQDNLFTRICPRAEPVQDWYSAISAVAVLLHWFLLLDLTTFSTKVSAFLLACQQMLSQIVPTAAMGCLLVLAFATTINTLAQVPEVDGAQGWALTLLQLTLGTLPDSAWHRIYPDTPVLVLLGVFSILMVMFILNLFLAQMVETYGRNFADLQGFARLDRAFLVAAMAESIPRRRWNTFLANLHFEEHLEFSQGDRGPAGGVQVFEPANAHMVVQDTVLRFGGSSSPDTPWPELEEHHQDRFERLEKMLIKARRRNRRRLGHLSGSDKQSGGTSQLSSLSPRSARSPTSHQSHPTEESPRTSSPQSPQSPVRKGGKDTLQPP